MDKPAELLTREKQFEFESRSSLDRRHLYSLHYYSPSKQFSLINYSGNCFRVHIVGSDFCDLLLQYIGIWYWYKNFKSNQVVPSAKNENDLVDRNATVLRSLTIRTHEEQVKILKLNLYLTKNEGLWITLSMTARASVLMQILRLLTSVQTYNTMEIWNNPVLKFDHYPVHVYCIEL